MTPIICSSKEEARSLVLFEPRLCANPLPMPSNADLLTQKNMVRRFAITPSDWKNAFGTGWQQRYGLSFLPLSDTAYQKIYKLLVSACPFTGGSFCASHILACIPKGLTLPKFQNMLAERPGRESLCFDRTAPLSALEAEPHWSAITKKFPFQCEGQSYAEQKNYVESLGYELPKALDAAVCMVMYGLKFDEPLFTQAYYPPKGVWSPFTRCRETDVSAGEGLAVGNWIIDGTGARLHVACMPTLAHYQFGAAPALQFTCEFAQRSSCALRRVSSS